MLYCPSSFLLAFFSSLEELAPSRLWFILSSLMRESFIEAYSSVPFWLATSIERLRRSSWGRETEEDFLTPMRLLSRLALTTTLPPPVTPEFWRAALWLIERLIGTDLFFNGVDSIELFCYC